MDSEGNLLQEWEHSLEPWLESFYEWIESEMNNSKPVPCRHHTHDFGYLLYGQFLILCCEAMSLTSLKEEQRVLLGMMKVLAHFPIAAGMVSSRKNMTLYRATIDTQRGVVMVDKKTVDFHRSHVRDFTQSTEKVILMLASLLHEVYTTVISIPPPTTGLNPEAARSAVAVGMPGLYMGTNAAYVVYHARSYYDKVYVPQRKNKTKKANNPYQRKGGKK